MGKGTKIFLAIVVIYLIIGLIYWNSVRPKGECTSYDNAGNVVVVPCAKDYIKILIWPSALIAKS